MAESESDVREYDVVVLGAGPTGENVAGRVIKAGLTAVIVESELVGGECSYWACMPSKALLRSPAVLVEARAVDGAKQAVVGELDVAAVLKRRDSFASLWHDDGQVSWLESAGIDLVRGRGRLTGTRRVDVEAGDGTVTRLGARHAVVVATGSSPVIPPIDGLAEARPWTNREATGAQEIPSRLAVIGGGVVGCEMATAHAQLGAEVTMFVRDERPLPRLEPFAGDAVAAGLRELGVDVRTGVGVQSVRRPVEGGPVTITTDAGDTVEVDEVLAATGRSARTEDVGLETVGLRPGQWLDVDDTCRLVQPGLDWLYSCGDPNHRALLTHMGKYQARICAAAIVARARGEQADTTPWSAQVATADNAAVPQVIFTTPEVATVGLSEREATEAGLKIRSVDYDLGWTAGGSLHADDYTGTVRMIVDAERRVIVGVTFVGVGVAELLHAATIAVVGEVPLERLWHAVPAYPTVSEIWLRLLEEYGL